MTGPAALARECRSKTSGAVSPAVPGHALLAIEAEFPGWHVWRSRWWATRTGPDAHWVDGTRRPMTVDADNEDALRAVLAGYREDAGA